MIPIFLDTSALAAEFNLTKADVDNLLTAVVKDLTTSAYEQWMIEAGKALGKSRQQYQRGLIVVSEGKFKGAVVLNGALPNMIESGASAFDMKVGFSKGRKVKRGPNGWYMTIPFRLATPGAAGFSEVFAGSIPTAVYKVVQKQPTVQMKSGETRTKGLSFGQIPKQFQAPTIRAAVNIGGQTFDTYVSKTSKYQGVTKIQNSTGGGQVFGFRRVSQQSDPGSWIHTGITARNLSNKVIGNLQIEKRIDIVIDNFLASKGF